LLFDRRIRHGISEQFFLSLLALGVYIIFSAIGSNLEITAAMLRQ
jgi:hypothetical protein